jgi:hypothetical protein
MTDYECTISDSVSMIAKTVSTMDLFVAKLIAENNANNGVIEEAINRLGDNILEGFKILAAAVRDTK